MTRTRPATTSPRTTARSTTADCEPSALPRRPRASGPLHNAVTQPAHSLELRSDTQSVELQAQRRDVPVEFSPRTRVGKDAAVEHPREFLVADHARRLFQQRDEERGFLGREDGTEVVGARLPG